MLLFEKLNISLPAYWISALFSWMQTPCSTSWNANLPSYLLLKVINNEHILLCLLYILLCLCLKSNKTLLTLLATLLINLYTVDIRRVFQLSYPAGEEIAGGTEVPGVLKGQDIALMWIIATYSCALTTMWGTRWTCCWNPQPRYLSRTDLFCYLNPYIFDVLLPLPTAQIHTEEKSIYINCCAVFNRDK